MITEQSIIVAAQQQVSGELPDGDVVILNLNNGVYYGLNQVGARIWELIKEPISVRDICRSLLNEYDIDENQCTQDILQLLSELEANQLISLQGESLHSTPSEF